MLCCCLRNKGAKLVLTCINYTTRETLRQQKYDNNLSRFIRYRYNLTSTRFHSPLWLCLCFSSKSLIVVVVMNWFCDKNPARFTFITIYSWYLVRTTHTFAGLQSHKRILVWIEERNFQQLLFLVAAKSEIVRTSGENCHLPS